MIIGTVKEIKSQESRVGLTPESVTQYVLNGHTVYVEKGAGEGCDFSDLEYEKAGAKILTSASEVWEKSNMIVKVKEPLETEYKYFREGLIIYTYLHLAADEKLTRELIEKGVTAIAYESIELSDGSLPCLKPMSMVAGRLAAIEGAKHLQRHLGGRGILISGLPGTSRAVAVVVGAGIVGENAIAMLVGAQARVIVLDVNIERLNYLESLYQSKIETLYSNEYNLLYALEQADLVISGVLLKGAKAPKIIKREYYKKMKKGAVIVDVAIDQGGTTEVSRPTTHENPTVVVDGIVHYMVANMPGAVPRTAATALNHQTVRYGLMLANLGVEKAIKNNEALNKGVNVINYECVNEAVKKTFNL